MAGINMLVNSMVNQLQNLEVQDPKSSKYFTVGEKLQAQVIAQEGDNFLLQSAARYFRAQSDLNLMVGDKLLLLVTEQQDGCTTLKLQVPTEQLLQNTAKPDFSPPKSDIGANIKPGQYLQAQVKASADGLMLVSSQEGMFTVKLANPLPEGTEIVMLVQGNPTENGEAELQLWQMKSGMPMETNNSGGRTATQSGNQQTITAQASNAPVSSTQVSSTQISNPPAGSTQAADIQPAISQGAIVQGVDSQATQSQVIQAQATINFAANVTAAEGQTINAQAVDTSTASSQAINQQLNMAMGKPMMAKLMFDGGAGFLPGSIFTATVKDKVGQYYLIEAGDKKYFLESDSDLPIGGKLQLVAKETVNNKISLQRYLPQQENKDQAIEKVRELAAKYGKGEKEVAQLAEKLTQLPVDTQTGVRYLLDPNLAAAVIIPASQKDMEDTKIEINEYKESQGGQRVWEVSLDVSLTELGPVEIVLKLVDEKIYTRIWAEDPSTEALLRERQKEMEGLSTMLEIVSTTAGPLIPREPAKNIDLKA